MSIDGGLRAIFHENLPRYHWQAIETGMTGRGVPDSNFCAPGGIDGWIEFKQTEGYTVDLRPEQIGWLCRRHRNQGRVFVAVRRQANPKRGEPTDELWLMAGGSARELRTYGLPGGPRHPWDALLVPAGTLLGVWPGGPAHWDWDAVATALEAT